jgi:hypothetical protein
MVQTLNHRTLFFWHLKKVIFLTNYEITMEQNSQQAKSLSAHQIPLLKDLKSSLLDCHESEESSCLSYSKNLPKSDALCNISIFSAGVLTLCPILKLENHPLSKP